MARSSTTWGAGQSGNRGGRPKRGETITDLLRQYLNDCERIERGKGARKQTVLMRRKDLLIRAMVQAAVKGSVSGQRLLMAYLDGLPKPGGVGEGRLIDLAYDLAERTPEDEAHYEMLLSQFFIEPVEMREQARKMDEQAPLFARLKVLRDAGVDIFDDAILERWQPPPGRRSPRRRAGDPRRRGGAVSPGRPPRMSNVEGSRSRVPGQGGMPNTTPVEGAVIALRHSGPGAPPPPSPGRFSKPEKSPCQPPGNIVT
ncbi:hypothetical protein ES707_12582 [subsurface metagenome]